MKTEIRSSFRVMLCSCLILIHSATWVFAQSDPESDRPRLEQLLKQARDMDEKDYSFSTWNDMRRTMTDVQGLVKQPDASAAQVKEACAKLGKAIGAMQKRKVEVADLPPIGLCGSLFLTSPTGAVNNVALQWASREPCDRFDLDRSTSAEGPFTRIYSGSGASFNDYALADGTYFYRLTGHRGDNPLVANIVSIQTLPLPTGLRPLSNQVANEKRLPEEPLVVRGTHYKFDITRDNRQFVSMQMRTSSDGVTWSEPKTVMDRTSHPDFADCKFEAESMFYDSVNDQIVFWAHWELSNGYAHGRAAVATAKPGEAFKVHRVFNPQGVEVRDMSTFVDEDRKCYLAAASNVRGQGANATLYIFRLNDACNDITEIVAKIAENGYREAPHIIRKDGFYYLFYSQAAGWHPSQGGYVVAKSLSGPWSGLRTIGNASTFSAQSGGILEYGDVEPRVPVMMANRWLRGEGTSPNSSMPIHFAPGFAFYDYAPVLLHNPASSSLIPLHCGRLLSQDKPIECSLPGNKDHDAARAVDGRYDSSFQSDKKNWPFSLTVDLQKPSALQNVQISWFIAKGSEAYYTYTIEGSSDGKSWTKLADRSNKADPINSKTYGFTSDLISGRALSRYVRLNVLGAHLHNNPNNWYPPTIYEFKVFGEASEDK